MLSLKLSDTQLLSLSLLSVAEEKSEPERIQRKQLRAAGSKPDLHIMPTPVTASRGLLEMQVMSLRHTSLCL